MSRKAPTADTERLVGSRGGKSGGRRPLTYFLPGVLIGIVLLLAVAGFAYRTVERAHTGSAHAGMQAVAGALAQELAADISAHQRLLVLAAQDAVVVEAVTAGDTGARERAVDRLSSRLPEFLQLRLLPLDWNRTDTTGAAPMGYAGVDLHRRAVKAGKAQPAEVHQLKSDRPYVALSVPVRSTEGGVVGTLFGALALQRVRELVDDYRGFPGRVAVVQGDPETGFRVAGGAIANVSGDRVAAVASTIWKVVYQVDGGAFAGGADMLLLLGAAALGVLGIVVIGFLQARKLSTDLRTDLGAVVSLGEAIRDGRRVASPGSAIASFSDSLILLSDFTRDGRLGGQAAAPRPAEPASTPAPAAPNPSPSPVQGIQVESEAAEPASRPLPPEVFRACDIRGRVGDDIHAAGAHRLGQALGTLVRRQGGDDQVLLARDARDSSPALHEALRHGLMSTGAAVVDLGAIPTPLMYFGVHRIGIDTGVVVTGSHNGPDINGFKLMLAGLPLAGTELRELCALMEGGDFASGQGGCSTRDLTAEYIEQVTADVRLGRALNVVLDGGNGVAGELVAQLLEAIGCKVTRVRCEPDGSFPNGAPDPNRPEVLAALELELEAGQADLGLAIDGDGDRVAVVDERGRFIAADKVLMLLAQDILIRHPGGDVLYDVGSSRHLAGFILSNGGRPVMWKSGHAHMNAKMRETGALLGGEFSGHYYVKERWHGYDDAIYAVARLLEVLTADPRNASELVDELPSSESTPEFRLALADGQCEPLIAAIAAQGEFPDAKIIDLDGLRVEYPDRWGLVRCAHTEPALVFRFEADDEASLERVKQEFRDLLNGVLPDEQAPF